MECVESRTHIECVECVMCSVMCVECDMECHTHCHTHMECHTRGVCGVWDTLTWSVWSVGCVECGIPSICVWQCVWHSMSHSTHIAHTWSVWSVGYPQHTWSATHMQCVE